MPGAAFIGPTVNRNPGGMISVRGLVLHIQQGYEGGSEAWFKNPAAQASAHFLNPKTGGLRQLVDTTDEAWAQMAGNRYWISVENEGFVPDSLTASQIENAAQLLAWLHVTFAVPLAATDDPTTGRGLGWHGMGGAAWGGHTGCPGDAIKAQRPAIIQRASHITNEYPPLYQPFPGTSWFTTGRRSPVIEAMHHRLMAVDCSAYQTSQHLDTWGSGDVASYAKWQHKCGYTGKDADGIPGKVTWDKLHVPYTG
jgi:hypothetical protein